MTTITVERGLLEQAVRSFVGYRRERMLILGDEENEPCDAEKALREALSAPATAPDTSESVVWKATSISGDTAHFGIRSAAKAWARSGTVEAVPLRNLRLVPKPDAPCKTCESLVRAVMMDQVSNDYAPSWHDAPTCAGKWANSVNWRVHKVLEETLGAYQDTNARWFGPIPEDKS